MCSSVRVSGSKGNVAAARRAQSELGVTFSADGLLVAGCPVGTPEFVRSHAERCADKAEQLVDRLMELKLPLQDKQLILRFSLQEKLSHLARCAEFQHISESLTRTERKILDSVYTLIGAEPDPLSTAQLRLPLRLGGIGLRHLTDHDGLACKAGYLAAAALTEKAMEEAPNHFNPFCGESAVLMQVTWGQVGPALQALESSAAAVGVANPTAEDVTCGAQAEAGPQGPRQRDAPPATPQQSRHGGANSLGPGPDCPGAPPLSYECTATASASANQNPANEESGLGASAFAGTSQQQWPLDSEVKNKLPHLQRHATYLLAGARYRKIMGELEQLRQDDKTRQRAEDDTIRMLSLSTLGTEWLNALPVEQEDNISDMETKGGLRFMLGLTPAILQNRPVHCPCGKIVGFDMNHAFSNCAYLGKTLSWRHNYILKMLRLGAQVAGFDTVLENKQFEVERALGMGTSEHCRRGDCLLCDGDQLTDIDVSGTHPMHPTYRSGALKRAGDAAEKRDADKHRRHDPGARAGYSMLAFSFETFGHLSSDAEKVVR